MLMTMMLIMSLTLITLNHPISMGAILLMQTILISLKTGLMNSSFWFSYILFLVMIGGMLILFVYMTSIASNEKFKFSIQTTLIWIMMTMIMMLILSKNLDLELKTKEIMMFMDSSLLMNMNLKYFSPFGNKIMISAMIYLLIVLIMIVKITKKTKGPIRQKN